MYSKQLRKALSMVMVIAMIMSVCAVCFGTFGNAYTVNGAPSGLAKKTYTTRWKDSVDYDANQYGGAIVHNYTVPTAGDGGVTHAVTPEGKSVAERMPDATFYGQAPYIQLVDKDLNLGSTDGSFVIEKGNTYDISMTISRVSNDDVAVIALGLLDASGNVFHVARADVDATLAYDNDTFMRFSKGADNGTKRYLKATIDGDAKNTYVSGGAAYAGCSVVLIYCGIKGANATLVSHTTTVKVTDKSAKAYTVNYRRDSDNFTNYPTTGGTGKPAVKTDLVWNYSGSGASYLYTTDNIFRFCFAAQNAANDTSVSGNYYPDPTHVYHVGEASEYSTGYEFFRVADPDLATTANPLGKVVIGDGKMYSFSVQVIGNNYSDDNKIGENHIWVSYGLYNPVTNAVYPLPYDESKLTNKGADTFAYYTSASSFHTKTITATVDCTTIGPDLNPYAGCELVIMGGGTRKGANFKIKDISIVEVDSPTSVKEGAAASIRPEIKKGDLDKFGTDFEYKGYQSAGIRFQYTVADEKIANATDLGFVVGVDALLDAEGADPYGEWYDAASAMKTSTLGKKYADLDAGDTYAVTITGLSKEDKVDSLRSNYFYVAFYYTVNGVTTYVPLEIDGATEVAYDSVLQLYGDLVEAGDFDADVYGDIAWYYYN